MPLVQKPFGEIVTYSRDSGATRVNQQGKIVGVDFSTTSVTFGTGAKTFTLAADFNNNRDWPVGSRVRATSQAAPLGLMNGTVTSYNPATQQLVINVTESTGTGSGTNWRIGSLEFRRDFDPVTLAPKGGLVEGGATNVWTPASQGFDASGFSFGVDQSFGYSFGIPTTILIATPDVIGQHGFNRNVPYLIDQLAVYSFLIRPINGQALVRIGTLTAESTVSSFDLNLQTGEVIRNTLGEVELQPYPNGYFLVKCQRAANTTGQARFSIYMASDGGNFSYTGNGRGIEVTRFQIEAGRRLSSYMPVTTVAVSRAADVPNVDGQRLLDFYNNEGGALYFEGIPSAGSVSTVAAALNDGTLNNSLRIGQKQSGTNSSIRAIASDGVTDILGLSATGNNIVRSNGVDYTEADTGQVANGFAVASAGVGQFIVGGTNGFYSITDDGGATWDNFQLDVADRTQLTGAAFGNGVYVVSGNAIGGSGFIATIDPETGAYTRRTFPINSNINNVRFLNGAFYACSIGMYRSLDDGITWTSAGTSSLVMLDVAFGNEVYISTRNAGSGVFVSADGNSFNTQTVITGFPGGIVRAADFANGVFVVAGSQGGIATSLDNGATWALRTSGTVQDLYAVRYSIRDEQWYAAGDNGRILRATDPTGTWENISNDAVTSLVRNGVVQANPKLGNWVPGEVNRVVTRFSATGVSSSINGGAVQTDNTVSIFVPTQLSLGMNGVSGQQFNGWIRRVGYRTDAVSDASLQECSAGTKNFFENFPGVLA